MANHLEIAKTFVQQKLVERDDIVGVLLVGSVARGDATEFSDVDLRVIVEQTDGNWLSRDGLDSWIDGIYIDAGLVAKDTYAAADKVLKNPTVACDLNDAIILHDTANFLSNTQQEVRAKFMHPKWIGSRINPHMDRLPVHIAAIQSAIEADDPLNLCIHAGRLMYRLALIPLFVHGLSPSSTRTLVQLEQISKPLVQKFYELEGTNGVTLDRANAGISILAQLTKISGAEKWGALPEYMVQKTSWMVEHSMAHAALHTAWLNCGFRIKDCLDTEDSTVIAEAMALTKDWLSLMQWDGENVSHEKFSMIRNLQAEMVELSSEYIENNL